jgi:O-antigen/teichoic acid export membrane protein
MLYERTVRAILLFVAPVVMLLYIFGKPFLALWAGAEYGRESAPAFYILLVGVAFSACAQVPHMLLMASGRPSLIARFHVVEVVPYLLFAALLSYRFGAVGAAAAWSVLATVNTVLLFVLARRVTGLAFSPLRTSKSPYAVALALLVVPVLSARTADSLAASACAAFISLLLYACVVWARVLSDDERVWIRGIVPRQLSPILRGSA